MKKYIEKRSGKLSGKGTFILFCNTAPKKKKKLFCNNTLPLKLLSYNNNNNRILLLFIHFSSILLFIPFLCLEHFLKALHHNLLQLELEVCGLCGIQKFMFLYSLSIFHHNLLLQFPNFKILILLWNPKLHPLFGVSIYSSSLAELVIIAAANSPRLFFSADSKLNALYQFTPQLDLWLWPFQLHFKSFFISFLFFGGFLFPIFLF